MDRAVSRFDFRAVSGKKVYLDDTYIKAVTDAPYLTSSLRQQMLAAGCILKEARTEADYVVEVRAGVVGTDRRDLLFGVPATQIPAVIPMPTAVAAIPEMPLATRTEQRAVAKLACFAYNRHTGRPIWQSGIVPVESESQNIFVLGAGPFQKGDIYEGTKFAGQELHIPLITDEKDDEDRLKHISVADEAYFEEPKDPLADGDPKEQLAKKEAAAAKPSPTSPPAKLKPAVAQKAKPLDAKQKVVPASHTEPVKPPTAPPKSTAEPAKPPADAAKPAEKPVEPSAPPPKAPAEPVDKPATPAQPPATPPSAVDSLPAPLPEPEAPPLGLPLFFDDPSYRDLLPGTSGPR